MWPAYFLYREWVLIYRATSSGTNPLMGRPFVRRLRISVEDTDLVVVLTRKIRVLLREFVLQGKELIRELSSG